MRDADLARLEHENMIAAIGLAGRQVPGAVVERTGGVALIATGLPFRLFNQVIVESDEASPGAIAAAVATTRDRGDQFIVSLRATTDDRFVPLMAELGLVAAGAGPWMPGLAFQPLPPVGAARDAASAPGLEIRPVVDPPGIEDHVRAAAGGFGLPIAFLEAIMNTSLARTPGATVYVGYADGLPVTSGLGVRTGDTIGVYNIATVERARRRGYGAAMTMRIVADGAAEGCDVAVLQATDMGRPIYERLGFRTVVEYHGYVDPAPVVSDASG